MMPVPHGEESVTQTHNMHVPRLKMTRVHIPFTFRLLDTRNNSYDGECLFVVVIIELNTNYRD